MLITRSEFASKCHVDQAYITQYIQRGKIIVTNNKIDLSNEQNKYFMERRLEKSKSKVEELSKIEIDIFDELDEKYNNDPYNLKAEKEAIGVMKKAAQDGVPFVLYPKAIAFNAISTNMIEVYEGMAKMEIERLVNAGKNITEQQIKLIVNDYADKCKTKILSTIKSLDNFIDEIFSEY